MLLGPVVAVALGAGVVSANVGTGGNPMLEPALVEFAVLEFAVLEFAAFRLVGGGGSLGSATLPVFDAVAWGLAGCCAPPERLLDALPGAPKLGGCNEG